LLRNGLDYLGYQQYERALKFLREAEVRQKELNDAVRLALKQGIERAQNGLRAASDAESPYALSERSRRRGGFIAPRPQTAVAGDLGAPRSPAQANAGSRPNESAPRDEGPGEPIRLASAEYQAAPAQVPDQAASASQPTPSESPASGPPARQAAAPVSP